MWRPIHFISAKAALCVLTLNIPMYCHRMFLSISVPRSAWRERLKSRTCIMSPRLHAYFAKILLSRPQNRDQGMQIMIEFIKRRQ